MLGSFMYSTCFFVLFLLFCIILKYNYIPFRNCHFMFFTMWIFFIRVLKYWTSSGGLEVGGVFCLFFYTLANTQTFLGLHIKLQILNYFDGKKKNWDFRLLSSRVWDIVFSLRFQYTQTKQGPESRLARLFFSLEK